MSFNREHMFKIVFYPIYKLYIIYIYLIRVNGINVLQLMGISNIIIFNFKRSK